MSKDLLARDFTEYLYNRLPSIYRDTDYDSLLKRLLECFSEGGFIPLSQDTMHIMDLLDIDKCPSKFLPHLCSMFGYEYTLELPELFQRRLLKYIVEMYKRKGTKSVVKYIARELTGYESEIIENKDFTPYDTEVTGWTVEFRNYRNFILKLTAPYEDYSMYNKEDIVVKLVNEFLPTNSQVFIITSYWFEDSSNNSTNSDDTPEGLFNVVDVTNYGFELASRISYKEEVQQYAWTMEYLVSRSKYTFSELNTIRLNTEYYTKVVTRDTSESLDTTTMKDISKSIEILPEGSTTFKSCDIMGEKSEDVYTYDEPLFNDETSRLNYSTQLYTNHIVGYDIVKKAGKPDEVIII